MTNQEKRKLNATIDYELTKIIDNHTKTQEEYHYAWLCALQIVTNALYEYDEENDPCNFGDDVDLFICDTNE